MKAVTLRTFQTVHTWAGLIAGFALFVAFYAGALTVFHDAIATWQNPPWRSAPDAHVPLSALVDRFVTLHPKARDDFGVVLPSDGAHAAYVFWLSDQGSRYASYSQLAAPRDESDPGNLADFVYALHDSLGWPTVGLYIMGIASVLYGLALVSGVLIHLPHLVSDLFAMRVGRNLKRLWQDAHNAIGVVSLPFHIIFAVTGALFCLFTPTLAALNWTAFDGKLYGQFAQAVATAPTLPASGVQAIMQTPQALIARARQAALASDVTTFDPDYMHFVNYGDRNAVVQVRGKSLHTLATYGDVALAGADGRVLSTYVGSKHSINTGSNWAMYGLHFGTYGGTALRWLYLGLGLAGAFLFYSGNVLWIESRRKRRHLDQPRRTRVMARVTIGVCIGTCLGISGAFAAVWLSAYVDVAVGIAQRVAFYGLLCAALAYAFTRPIAQAAVHLLGATAALTALVACADLARNAATFAADFSQPAYTVLGVDLTGLALAWIFARLAIATMRRARHGDPNSVWSAHVSI
ncbi:MAG TPA: PepSY-associated TM helix domain-containing protein [Dyella sp.]|uniref:PepSY-associated TM helix domain-containing protein n=1 Tax=Dyella sp. TaxID=1869338 RepID=UPI002CDA67E6|nr:PepSY-associated TM helix domain-containing protein [Dyella sp.]HTV85414.1 PepSY-associated TM helix domain-containing protein [Dyella sp.]